MLPRGATTAYPRAMGVLPGNPLPSSRGFPRVPRLVWHTIGLVVATLLAWAIWRGYQNPDLLLDLGALKLC